MTIQRYEEKSMQKRVRERQREREREGPQALWLLFLYVFSPPGPALCKLG